MSETDPNNATTSVTYDSFGRFTGLTKPGDASPTLTVSYQTSPFVVTLNQVIDATHTFTVTRYYDGLGRQYQTNTNGVLVNSTFNAFGKPLTQSTPHSGSETVYYTTTTYDALGRALTVTAPDGSVTTSIFDGLTTSVTDANNHTRTTVTDILRRILSVTPPTGPVVSFTYDALGNMLTATRGGATVFLTYDVASRKIAMNDPDMGNWSYLYDALGSMTSQTDARNCTTNLTYDLLGRPTSKTYSNCPSTPSVSYTYDQGTNGIGRKSSASDASGLTTWMYDIRGRVTAEAKQFTGLGQYVTYYTYNSADLPVNITYPDGEVVTTKYDNMMLFRKLVNENGTPNDPNDDYYYVSDTTYDSASRMTARTLGNGLTQNYAYYAGNQQGGRLQTLSTGSLQNFTYQYDPVGNILSVADSINSQTQTFDYDALDRLWHAGATGISQQGGYATETYEYDPATGNLSSKAGVNYTYNSGHAHAVSSLSNGNSYVYDANGNMTTRNADGKSYTFAYDAENRLISVSGDSTATFVYNGDGQRVKSVMDGGTTLFVGGYYEIANPGAGQTITKYYMAGASRVALRKDGTLSYTLADHLGSTSLVTDANGNRTSELRYKPWGETRFSFGTMPTKYTFTGQFSYMDDPSTPGLEGFGLMYYGARWADVSLGRFAQADTVVSGGPQGLDRYAYGLNNPVKYSDPTGHMADQGDGGSPIAISIALQVTPLKQEKGDSCGESAFTMAYNHSHRTDISETEVRNTAEENKWFTPGVLPFTSPSQMEDIANHYTNGNYESGQITNSRDGYNLLLSQLQSGNTIIVDYVVDPNNVSGTGSDAHFVVVTGMTNNNGQIMITYNDPWTGQQTTMDWYTFSTAWLTNNDDHGAGNGWWMVVPPVDCNTDPSNPECQPPTSTPTSTPPQ